MKVEVCIQSEDGGLIYHERAADVHYAVGVTTGDVATEAAKLIGEYPEGAQVHFILITKLIEPPK